MSRLLLEWQRTLGQRVSLVLADCLQSPRALRFCDLIKQLSQERHWRPGSVMGTLLKSVTEACGPGHKEALDSFYNTVKDAWLNTGEWWPPKKGPIHIDIEKIFSKLCIDLRSSLSLEQEEEDSKNDSTEYLLVSLDFSISGANGMKSTSLLLPTYRRKPSRTCSAFLPSWRTRSAWNGSKTIVGLRC